GRVAPVASATITLELKGEIGLANMFEMVKAMATRAETDASGAFQLHHAPSGAFNLVARTKDGTTGRLEVSIGTTDQTGLVIPITPRASIAGKVVDTRGTPVPGMRVTVKRDGDREGAMRITMDGLNNEVTTRADGSFKIVGLEPGTYAVHARDPKDYSHVTAEARDKPVEVELAEAQARTGVTLTVEARDGVIRGVVIGADRKPAADAWVTARLENPDSDPEETSFLELASSEPVLTAADGRFAIERLRKGTYRLVVEGPRGSSRGEKSGIKTGDSVTITLAPLGTLAIRASSRGAPVTSYDLSCDGPSDVSRHVSSADGSYKLERVAPGDYTCSASAQIGTAGAKVNVPAGPAQLDLTFTPWASLTGLVVNAVSGAPVQGALVIPRSDLRSNNGAEIFEAITGKGPTTDAAGRFVIERVPEGPGIVMVFATGASMSSPLQSQSYKAVAGQRLDVGTIKVIAPVTGDPGTFGLATEPGGTGLKVTMVVDGGPAAAAGLKVDDVIVSIDGRPVTDIGVDTAGLLLSSGSVGVGQTIRLGLTSGATIAVTSVKWG
ncbi:MAG: carboxypeptidase regulatory-like domain-containing protein, partial [Kofleriaceae bacterium]